MKVDKLQIPIQTKSGDLYIEIYGESPDSLCEITEVEAESYGESKYQIKEGHLYEYKISNHNYRLRATAKEIVKESKIEPNSGRLAPNIYVGTLLLELYEVVTLISYTIKIEVISVKAEYREDYRIMLSEITTKCTELLMQHTSPVVQNFEPDYIKDPKTIYQKFAFLKSIIDSEDFNDSLQKIIASPTTGWKEIENDKDIRSIRKLNNKAVKQIVTSTHRTEIPNDNYLKGIFSTIPSRLKVTQKSETIDTPENRFIKYILNSFLTFCNSIKNQLIDNTRDKLEAENSEKKLEEYLSHPVFKEISSAEIIPLNSPILQKKEGYREILRIWLMFNLAAKLIWSGGENVYEAGKRDVAVLYEYWLFFKLLDIIKSVFDIDPVSLEELIVKTKDGLGLRLQQGNRVAVKGIYNGYSRKLNVEFSYNRTFNGEMDYPEAGSWTKNMRPDYTLTIWPLDIPLQADAENQELIVHIHFDAKYKIDNLYNIFCDDIDLDEEKIDQNKGRYKRADLLKMHSYRDAIRRTGGAYILYPGMVPYKRMGFHEIIPGLGAFPMRPSKTDTGEDDLKSFIRDVLYHFINRTSQREKAAYSTFEIYKRANPSRLIELLPETIGDNRGLLPDETSILIAYYKNQEHLDWILKYHLYNARTGSSKGAISITSTEAGAKYLLLYTNGQKLTDKFYKIKSGGPKILSKDELLDMGYPNPNHNFYLVFDIETEIEKEFTQVTWDISKLDNYPLSNDFGTPKSYSLTKLMKTVLK